MLLSIMDSWGFTPCAPYRGIQLMGGSILCSVTGGCSREKGRCRIMHKVLNNFAQKWYTSLSLILYQLELATWLAMPILRRLGSERLLCAPRRERLLCAQRREESHIYCEAALMSIIKHLCVPLSELKNNISPYWHSWTLDAMDV